MRMLERIDAMLNSRLFLRIASVVIAVLIWLYAAGERNAETVKTFEVSLEYRNLGVGLTLSDAPDKVNVQVTGARNILAAMTPQNLIATVDLRDLGPGRHTLPVTSLAPSGVRITTVTPPYAEVQVLRLIEKTLPVSLNMEGTFPEGVSLESSDLDPREVLLRGDEALLQKIQKVTVVTTPQELIRGEGFLELPVRLPLSGRVEHLSVIPKSVVFSYTLKRDLPRREVPLRMHILGEVDPDFSVTSITVDPPSVILQGPSAQLDLIDQIDLMPLDISGMKETAVFSIDIVPPVGNDNEGLLPIRSATIRVTISPKSETRMISGVRVGISGKSIYPNWRVEPGTVEVVVKGLPSALENLPEVEAYVDVTNLVSRRATVPVRARSKGGALEIVEIRPPNVTAYAIVD
ncbi:CdaR family protein [Aminiphilus circumscriptus]|uniref:CdaR family protein n=1 Tax=Aminiphilus circumscriptus TaxID=290732 RepID=UPI0004928F2F|nr:CdaR family protein [Aminiphilus circumscriptus]